MHVTINGREYSRNEVHQIFEQGRKAVSDHAMVDEHGYIAKSLAITEICTHLLGSIPELYNYIHS